MAVALLVGTQASAQAGAQLPGFNLERLQTNTGRGTVLIGNGELMVPGGLSVSLLGHYQRMPLELDDGERTLQVVRDRATALLSASYGLLPWLEVSAQVPFVLWQQGDDPNEIGLERLTAQGLSTPVLQARLGLLSRRYRQPVDLSADLGVGLPFGSEQALAGDNKPRFHARMVVGAVVRGLNPSFEAGVLFRPSILLTTTEGVAKPGARSEIHLGASLATTGKGTRGELGLRAIVARQTSVEVLGGLRFPLLVGLDAFLLGGPGLGAAPGAAQFRMLAGVSFRQEPPPPISFIDEARDHELQLSMAKPTSPPVENTLRPVSTWEFNSLTRGERQDGAAGNEPAQEPLRPYQPTAQERLVLRGEVRFTQGSSALTGVVPLLDQVVLQWSEHPGQGLIIVEGHADTEKAETSDMFMSLQRAQAVRRYLVDQGIPGTRVRIRGMGSDWPISSRPATEQEHQLNRRAEVLVITKTEEEATTRVPSP